MLVLACHLSLIGSWHRMCQEELWPPAAPMLYLRRGGIWSWAQQASPHRWCPARKARPSGWWDHGRWWEGWLGRCGARKLVGFGYYPQSWRSVKYMHGESRSCRIGAVTCCPRALAIYSSRWFLGANQLKSKSCQTAVWVNPCLLGTGHAGPFCSPCPAPLLQFSCFKWTLSGRRIILKPTFQRIPGWNIYPFQTTGKKHLLEVRLPKIRVFLQYCEVGSWGDGENACVPCTNKEGFAFYSADAWPNSSCLYETLAQLEGRDGIGYRIWMDMVYIMCTHIYIYIYSGL